MFFTQNFTKGKQAILVRMKSFFFFQKDTTMDKISLFAFQHLFKTPPIIDIEGVLVMKSTSEGFDFQS